MFHIEEGHSAVTKGKKTVTFYRWKLNTDVVSLLLCRTVIVTLILLKFCILAKLVSFLKFT